VDANAAFGAIKLRVPETWRVVVHGDAVFGAFEDKTVPPRPGPGIDPPILIITGNAAFGAVEIEN
jgi:alkanesulfonate monooxygenase SsuD/methylene tetrahydromethanopterin reductase-like flavin-dependent oxidoreductase (luciferase family)